MLAEADKRHVIATASKEEARDESQQQLAHDFDTRSLKKTLDEALEQKASKQQPYRGAGAETWTTY